jgi:uncharacterized protein (DUF488 family)
MSGEAHAPLALTVAGESMSILPSPAAFTIGYTKKSLEEFVRSLQGAGVVAVIDIRLRNTSQLAGFAKRDDLAFLLRECFGIQYEHRPDLAPSAEMLDAYRADGDWDAYERAFYSLLDERDAEEAGRDLVDRFGSICLLCSEPTADKCHRRLLAEWWADRLPGMAVIHL